MMVWTSALRAPPVALSSSVAFLSAGPRLSPFSRSFTATACAVPLRRKVSQFVVISALAAVTSAGAVPAADGAFDAGGRDFVEALGSLLPPPQAAAKAATTS